MANVKGRMRGPRRALGIAALAWNIWRKLPSRQRRKLLGLARKHGPKLIRRTVKARRSFKRNRR
ncbi:MAG TPA: hypothetical protein VG265_07780 [Gaiellaceae bacterium]|jgi:hypothetical protein|nr:hypothetical protein [Gaiellaceae bacterium]